MLHSVGAYVRRHHLALVALFCALGGSAYAAATVGPSDIEPRAVRAKHVKPKAITGKHVKPRAIRTRHIRPNAVRARAIAGVNALSSSGRLAFPGAQGLARKQNVLVSARGQLSIDAECEGDLAEISARFAFRDPVPPNGTLVTILADDEPVQETVTNGVAALEFGESSSTSAESRLAGTFSAISPGGDVLQGIFHSAIGAQGSGCVLAVQGLG